MENMTINITRANVLHVVEGITATIAQHNEGVPTFEQLWASVSESKKLDIWWRDGIIDLEDNLMKFANSTSAQFNLTADGTDYTLTLTKPDRWSNKLTGLLANKIQYYLAHVVLAGWLSDFKDVTAPDYTELAANDMKSILNVLLYRDLDFTEAEHRTDSTIPSGEGDYDTSERRTDSAIPSGEGNYDTSERRSDSVRPSGEGEYDTSARRTDSAQYDGNGGIGDAVSRDKDDEYGSGCCGKDKGTRSRDNDDVPVLHHRKRESMDYNGKGIMLPDEDDLPHPCRPWIH